jgi:hypothetical protein
MRFDVERVRANVKEASTEDLLDRMTVYRGGMEPEALEIVEEELHGRGVDASAIEQYAARREREVILLSGGIAAPCSRCFRPAVVQVRGWHRLWGLLPVFPRRFYYCENHRPAAEQPGGAEGP